MVFSVGKALSLLCLVSGVFSTPLAKSRSDTSVAARSYLNPGSISFNNWGGLSSLSGFDNFYGSDNFFGSRNDQVVIIEQEEVCSVQEIVIIQQQLAIIQEFAKQIIIQQICDVETQIIVLQQFRGGMTDFSSDIRRQSSRNIGFDSNISSMISQIINSDGSINSRNLGFSGSDVGQHLRVPSGSNWDSSKSPQNINSIMGTIAQAVNSNNTVSSSSSNSTSSS